MRVKVYFGILLALLIGLATTFEWPPFPWSEWPTVLVLVALAVLAESTAFELPVGGTISLTFALYIAGLLYAGPVPAAIMAFFGAIPPQDIRSHKPLFRMAFNVVMLCLSVLAAGAVYMTLGGIPLVYSGPGMQITLSVLLPSVAAALTFYLLNFALFSAVIALSSNVSVMSAWREQDLALYLASFVILALLGFGVAQSISVAGWSGAALMVIPFAVARQTFQVYKQLADAYTDTIRSFIAAIEAKDPYTRGHSERVAHYSRGIAEAIGLRGRDLERVEFSALLHDVGKIGVSRSVLTKSGALTSAEYQEIRLHPETGCEILGHVDFLGEIVPIVRAHHERVDGSGYPNGTSSEEIPLEARVLAVADAFDAMTSNRPYRDAMSEADALTELKRVAGLQLDSAMVDALLQLHEGGGMVETR